MSLIIAFLFIGLVAEIFFRPSVRRSARNTWGIHGRHNSYLHPILVATIYTIHAFTLYPILLPVYLIGQGFSKIAATLYFRALSRADESPEGGLMDDDFQDEDRELDENGEMSQ